MKKLFKRPMKSLPLRRLSHYTIEEYLGALRIFLRHYKNCPLETMGEQEIRNFLLSQIEIGKAPGCVNNYNSALRFIFGAVLERNLNCRMIPRQRNLRSFPAIMNKYEIARFCSIIDNLRDKTMFETVYGAVLRVSEIAHLRTQDIDSKQMRIFVHQGKGGKDRFTLLSQRNLDILREYWKQYRPNHPEGYLFNVREQKCHVISSKSVQNAFNKYREKANIPKTFTVHTLLHCFATHLLESGVDVCQIKELLGHTFIQTTAFYLHLSNMERHILKIIGYNPSSTKHGMQFSIAEHPDSTDIWISVRNAVTNGLPTIPAATATAQTARPSQKSVGLKRKK